MQSNANVIHRWYKVIWEAGEWDQIGKYYSPAPEEDCLVPGGTISLDEARELIEVLHELISDHRITVVHTIEDGDWVAAFIQLDGTKVGTDEAVSARWQTMVRVEGDQIVESYPTADFLTFFEQMGQLPESTFELLLSGTILR